MKGGNTALYDTNAETPRKWCYNYRENVSEEHAIMRCGAEWE